MRLRIPFAILCTYLCFLPWSRSQELEALPKLEPSHIDNFSQSIPDITGCFQDFVESEDGRIWLSPCYNDIIMYALHLVQFDGYDFMPVEFGDQLLFPGVPTFISGINRQGQIFGFTNDAVTKVVFVIDLLSREAKKIDFGNFSGREGAVKNVIESKEGDLVVLFQKENAFQLYSINQDSISELASIPRTPIDQHFPGQQAKKLPLIENEEGFWFMDNYLPLYHFDRESGKTMVYGIKDLPVEMTPQKVFSGTSRFTKTNLIDRKGGLHLLLSAYEQKLFYFDFQTRQFMPETGFPDTWAAHYINIDQKGNLLRIFQDQDRQYKAILEDQQGNRYDYSAFANVGDERIEQMKSRDYFSQVFVCRRNNFISMGVRNIKGLKAFDVVPPRGVLGSLPDNSFLIYDQDERLNILKDEQLQPYSPGDRLNQTNCFLSMLDQKMSIRKLIRDRAGRLWVNYLDEFLVYDPRDQSCEMISVGLVPMRMEFLNDSTMVFFEGKSRSFYLFDVNKREAKPLLVDGGPLKISDHLNYLRVGRDGTIWQTTSRGVWKINPEKNESRIIGLGNDFPDFRFQDILEDEQGRYWLGTFAQGIVIMDASGKVLQVIDEHKGLASNSVKMILSDEEGYIWAATKNGLSLVTPQGEVVRNFSETDGLPSNTFIDNAHQADDGRLLIPMQKGLVLIDPRQLKEEMPSSPTEKIYLTEIASFDARQNNEVSHKILLPESLKVVLPAAHRYLKLNFALSSYIYPQANRYAYMLEGIDEDWNYIGNRHELNLSHLPAGKYRLLVKGADYRNNWTEIPLSISIHARELFYKQIWFYALIFGLGAILTFFWIRRLRGEKIRLEAEVGRRTQQIRYDKEVIEQQARELRELDELKSRFFTNISHELRTPITLITAPIEQLLRKPSKLLEKSAPNRLRMVLNNGRNLLRLVEELLDLSRLEAKKLELNETPTPLHAFCRQLFSAFESKAVMKKIQYTFASDLDEERQFWIDRKRLEKIVNNLLSNALKFTPDEGEVAFSLTKAADSIRIQVRDTGRGIPPEDLSHVFERYFQTKRKSIATEGGTGVGLALSKELARLMKGDLSVQSKWGSGSTFTLLIPARIVRDEEVRRPLEEKAVLDSTPEEETLLPIADPDFNKNQRPKVLIVEDNPDMQQLIHSLLAEVYGCQIANNGAEAWEWLNNGHLKPGDIDLILSDIMMPNMDGYTLLEHIKKHSDWQKKPVIMLTARANEEDKLQSLRMGVDDYLLKPFSPDELLVRVANRIENYRQRKLFLQEEKPAVKIEFEAVESVDQLWLKELEKAALSALDKGQDLNAAFLVGELHISNRQLYRRIKVLTGLTIKQYIQEVKLQKARHLLENKGYGTVAEVSYACGFGTPAYFSTIYEKQFGRRPSAYL